MTTIEVPLSKGYVATIDAEDADLVLQYRWSAAEIGRTVYAQRSVKRADGRWTTQKMHQLLTGFARTDHRDGNGLNNRRENLREATQRQNMCNQRRQSPTSGYKGVTWYKSRSKWRAFIVAHGTNHHIGYFATAEDAARAYDVVAREQHGEFATLNFPGPGEIAAHRLAETGA